MNIDSEAANTIHFKQHYLFWGNNLVSHNHFRLNVSEVSSQVASPLPNAQRLPSSPKWEGVPGVLQNQAPS